jgi:hypothetical protein
MITNFDKACNAILLNLNESQFTGPLGAVSDTLGGFGNIVKRFMNTELYQIASGMDVTRISSIPETINKGHEFYKNPSLLGAFGFLMSAASVAPVTGQVGMVAKAPSLLVKMLNMPLLIKDIILNKKPIMDLLQKESKEPTAMQEIMTKALLQVMTAKPKIEQQAKQLKAEVDQAKNTQTNNGVNQKRGTITITPSKPLG